jgi:hypothetical protein
MARQITLGGKPLLTLRRRTGPLPERQIIGSTKTQKPHMANIGKPIEKQRQQAL